MWKFGVQLHKILLTLRLDMCTICSKYNMVAIAPSLRGGANNYLNTNKLTFNDDKSTAAVPYWETGRSFLFAHI